MKPSSAFGLVTGLCAALLLAAPARAASGVPVDGTSREPRIALQVNDWTLSTAALNALLRVVREQKPGVTPSQVMAAAAEDRVLGGYARRQYDDAKLFAGERVRFSPQASVEASLVTTLQAAFRDPLAKAMGPAESYIVKRHPLTRERLVALLDMGGKLRLDDRLPAAREAKLKDVPLIDGRVGAQSYRVTLYELWERQDVQGRNALYRFDVGFAMEQARQLARDRFVLGWVAQNSDLGVDGVEQLRQLVADRNRRNALARLLGSGEDPHYSSPEVERLQRSVEPAAIRDYYNTHKTEFTRTEKVLARTMRLANEAQARAASAELAKGARFEDVARRRGAGDGIAKWIDSDAARRSWIAQLAFAQPPGPASPPIHEPESETSAQGWIIVKVDRRVTGFHPPDSETVRFAASEAIARQRAAAGFLSLRARLLSDARIDVNPNALGLRAAPKVLEGGL
ncbi:peptidylprolyl isomerase [Pseudomonas sp. CGJS7]|uniref:peptidylprolyl isomerase n=1 Tax=Pseudomonas sp. CGJS7 TaxID=3109348 RepID=UPI003009107F